MTRRLPAFALAALAFVLAACASQTRLSDVWVADGVKRGDYSKIMVLAVTPNQARRVAFEDALAKRITGAQVSHELFSLAEVTDRAKVQAKLKEQGFDGVLVVRLLAVDTQQSEMSGHAAMLNPNEGLYGYWDPAHAAWERDHVVTSRNVTMEVMFFDVATATRKFSAESQTYDPADQDQLADALFDALRAELKKRGVL
jgi:hypothetical protein